MHPNASRTLRGPAAHAVGRRITPIHNVRHQRLRCLAAAEQEQAPTAEAGPLPALRVTVAASAAEFRAAGYLRAHSFYSFPPDRSEFAARAHRRMKGDAEWEAIAAKVAGTDEAFKSTRVICVVATIPDDAADATAAAVSSEMDRSTKLPASGGGSSSSSSGSWEGGGGSSSGSLEGGGGSVSSSASSSGAGDGREAGGGGGGGEGGGGGPRIVVGSLDVNIGVVLPAEELTGQLPKDGTAATRRAYLSNVCVAPAARRRGVAAALMAAAEAHAAAAGVAHLYVHVVASNDAAAALYGRMGFVVEAEETEAQARTLGRPRRKILHKLVGQGGGGGGGGV
ncbi:MAG: hypothetical protein J3K34DRAFT_70518 [Monoraphidium minutum]|nr:MAG: hypothetical protein J3K34DRAFT_70518 [Monoraphidium minutum]